VDLLADSILSIILERNVNFEVSTSHEHLTSNFEFEQRLMNHFPSSPFQFLISHPSHLASPSSSTLLNPLLEILLQVVSTTTIVVNLQAILEAVTKIEKPNYDMRFHQLRSVGQKDFKRH